MFCPSTTSGTREFVVQTTGETRFVVDCKVNPVALAGHVKIKFIPEKSAEVQQFYFDVSAIGQPLRFYRLIQVP